MADVLCVIMGLLDITAGAVLLFGFGINFFTAVLGCALIGKGIFSFL